MSPFDPIAMLDEIQRLVPGYDISRLELLAGQDEHTQLVQITGATGTGHPELVLPSNDTLFTSGTLGRYSATLNTVMERYNCLPRETRKWRRITTPMARSASSSSRLWQLSESLGLPADCRQAGRT